MKKAVLLFLFTLAVVLGFGQDHYKMALAGQYPTSFIFASNVNVRSAPSLDSKVVRRVEDHPAQW